MNIIFMKITTGILFILLIIMISLFINIIMDIFFDITIPKIIKRIIDYFARKKLFYSDYKKFKDKLILVEKILKEADKDITINKIRINNNSYFRKPYFYRTYRFHIGDLLWGDRGTIYFDGEKIFIHKSNMRYTSKKIQININLINKIYQNHIDKDLEGELFPYADELKRELGIDPMPDIYGYKTWLKE